MSGASKRAAYLRGEMTHDDYYGLLVELLGEGALRNLLPDNRSAAEWAALVEQDRHLNNVMLRRWDNMDWHVRDLWRHTKNEDRIAITGSTGWSLSDSVCVLKCAARRYASTATEAGSSC